MGKSSECVMPPYVYGVSVTREEWHLGLALERKNRTSVDGSKGILPDTVKGRALAPTSNAVNALSAASEQSRSEECLLLRDDTDDALLDICSTSKPEECEGEDAGRSEVGSVLCPKRLARPMLM